jgi:sulfide:quinone oxidoreductase
MGRTTPRPERSRVLVAGGGVAALETTIALHDLAPHLVDVELLAPEHEFWYRPLAVAEPFGLARVVRFELGDLASSMDATFTLGALVSVDAEARTVATSHGQEVSYDTLVVACGARPVPALEGALTFRGPADSETFRRLLADVRAGSVESIAFVLPSAVTWGLPLYELALLTATYLERQGIRSVELTFVTHETEPLGLFGGDASDAVREVVERKGITLLTGTHAASYSPGELSILPGGELHADRVVALPRLIGPAIDGLPHDRDGFVSTDPFGRVLGVPHVYAAGDATTFPVKQGGLAAQQADAVARSIAAEAGADVVPEPFRPVLKGLLLTGGPAAYLRAELGGGHGDTAMVSGDALWWPPAKIVGRYLAPFLAGREEIDLVPPERPDAVPVRVDLSELVPH